MEATPHTQRINKLQKRITILERIAVVLAIIWVTYAVSSCYYLNVHTKKPEAVTSGLISINK